MSVTREWRHRNVGCASNDSSLLCMAIVILPRLNYHDGVIVFEAVVFHTHHQGCLAICHNNHHLAIFHGRDAFVAHLAS